MTSHSSIFRVRPRATVPVLAVIVQMSFPLLHPASAAPATQETTRISYPDVQKDTWQETLQASREAIIQGGRELEQRRDAAAETLDPSLKGCRPLVLTIHSKSREQRSLEWCVSGLKQLHMGSQRLSHSGRTWTQLTNPRLIDKDGDVTAMSAFQVTDSRGRKQTFFLPSSKHPLDIGDMEACYELDGRYERFQADLDIRNSGDAFVVVWAHGRSLRDEIRAVRDARENLWRRISADFPGEREEEERTREIGDEIWLEDWEPGDVSELAKRYAKACGTDLRRETEELASRVTGPQGLRKVRELYHLDRDSREVIDIDLLSLPEEVETLSRAYPISYDSGPRFLAKLADLQSCQQAISKAVAQGDIAVLKEEVAKFRSEFEPLQRDMAMDALRARAGIDDIVFAVRERARDGHWYADVGEDVYGRRKYYVAGGRLSRLNLRTRQITHLIDDPKCGVRDPQVHYDAGKILFSYRKAENEHYNLYEIDIDGTDLRQLTDGPFNDIEPTYMPDGSIVFSSTRCNTWVPCGYYPTFVLYRCDADGSNIRKLSSNITPENTPCPLPDGRVLYMRWEYVDRNQVRYQHLWTINPDGTSSMVYYGNQYGGGVYIDAKPIPGTRNVVFIHSPGHGKSDHQGFLCVVDPRSGPDVNSAVRRLDIGPELNVDVCRDPYPIAEDFYLFANERGIYTTDGKGKTRLIYSLPGNVPGNVIVHEPRPLRCRPREAIIPDRVNLREETGLLLLNDAYHGRKMEGVEPGEIKKLLVLEQLLKPAAFFEGQRPMSFGGTFTLKRILGTVPVEADGSAFFEVPAMRSLFFVSLDDRDLSVKRMQSFVTVQPGESTGCAGCHENRTETPRLRPGGTVMAARRAPSKIEPIQGFPDVFDYPRDIQPILDKHCLHCHNPDKRSGGVSLSGDRNEWFSESYTTLTMKDQISDGNNADGNRPPRSIGSSASALMKKIDGTHHSVEVPQRSRDMIRLWIETGANYAGTYGACGTGTYNIDREPINEVFARRCMQCHVSGPGSLGHRTPPYRRYDLGYPSAASVYNLSHPEKSWILMAPLAKEAGGEGRCEAKPNSDKDAAEKHAVFAGKQDPDYQNILACIERAALKLKEGRRFDMPGFRPNEHYLRHMKRYGLLPEDFDCEKDTIDTYEADQAYWRSLWHKPSEQDKK